MSFVDSREDDLIPFEKWLSLYNEMPQECRKVIDTNEQFIGIGRNEKYGWFLMGCGQGPFLAWSEKGIYD